jgi:hypothetical protein
MAETDRSTPADPAMADQTTAESTTAPTTATTRAPAAENTAAEPNATGTTEPNATGTTEPNATGTTAAGSTASGNTTAGTTAEATAADAAIWDNGQAEEIRRRWHDVQTRFVEDPKGSLGEARRLLDETVEQLNAGVRDREEQLEHAGARSSDSTEGMRATVLEYHHLLDRLLSV